jgi:hypothetical protein
MLKAIPQNIVAGFQSMGPMAATIAVAGLWYMGEKLEPFRMIRRKIQ